MRLPDECKIIFEPRDLWFGCYWTYVPHLCFKKFWFRVYICLIPTLPLVLTWDLKRWDVKKGLVDR